MLGVLVLAGQLALQEPPRFTMAPAAGDTTTAEVFDLKSSDVEAEVAGMLPGAAVLEIHSTDGLSMAYRAGTLPGGPIVMYANARPHELPKFACRMARDPQGVIDNTERAIRWCFTFVSEARLVLTVPPLPPPSGP